MAFGEKSAWINLVALLVGVAVYVRIVAGASAEAGELVAPALPGVIVYTVALVVVLIVGNVVAAALAPKDAEGPTDERDRTIQYRAANASLAVLSLGIVVSLGAYLINDEARLLFYSVFASLILASVADNVLRVVLYRSEG